MHRDKPLRPQITKNLHRFIGSHMHMSKRIREIGANRQQGDFRCATVTDFFEPLEIGAISSVKNSAPLMFKNKTAVTAMLIAEHPCPPVLGGCEGHFPIAV